MGISIDQYIEGKSKGLLGAVLGATIGNTISDTIGAIMDPTMRTAVIGITLSYKNWFCAKNTARRY